MYYHFNQITFNKLQSAYVNVDVDLARSFKNYHKTWYYLFLKFQDSVEIKPSDESNDTVDIIFAGDAAITQQLNQQLNENISIEAGFRWVGTPSESRTIHTTGFAIKIIHCHCASPLDHHSLSTLIYEQLSQIFLDNQQDTDFLKIRLINEISEKISRAQQNRSYKSANSLTFFSSTTSDSTTVTPIERYIKNKIKPITPRYLRSNEGIINPVYYDIKDVDFALDNHKLIWLLRADGTLAIGIKNSYWISFGETELADFIPEHLHHHLDWSDRYGHPSLAIKEGAYDGSAYYGGYLCQRTDHLQVFTSSGRYYRANDLNCEQKHYLEAYIAQQFQAAFGKQDIVFYEGPYKDFYELSLFFSDQAFPDSVKVRRYTENTQKSNYHLIARSRL